MRSVATSTTRQKILRAVRQMVRRGSDLPIDEVARRSGVSVQTIYTQFGSKRGLILAAIDDMQRDIGLYDEFATVYGSPHGEAALRRMIRATFTLWERGWPLVAFTLRARRLDPELGAQLVEVDTMRRTDLWIICRRLDAEGRLRVPGAPERAADLAFTMSTPTVFDDLAHQRGWTAGHVADQMIEVIADTLIDPRTEPVTEPPPDWGALGAGLRALTRPS